MQRLTQYISGYAHGLAGRSREKLSEKYYRGTFEATACVEKLAEYEDLEEQGRLLKPKCVPGDYVWEVNERGFISEYEVSSIRYGINKTFHYIWVLRDGVYSNLDGFFDKNIGITVFLTREEAEGVLKIMNEKEEQ